MPKIKLPHRVKQNENDIALLWDENQRIRRRIENVWGQVADRVPYGHLLYAQAAFLALPGLRGFWPMSVFDSSGNAQDVSGHGHHLTYNGDPKYGHDGLLPYIDLDGTGDYLSIADDADFDISGSESYVDNPGLTVGCLFNASATASSYALIAKYGAEGNRSFALYAAGSVRLYISDDGTNVDSVATAYGFLADQWYLAIARFDDSDTGSELKAWINGVPNTAATSRNSIYDSTADFTVGAVAGGSDLFPGNISLAFVCAYALPDDTIDGLYDILNPVLYDMV